MQGPQRLLRGEGQAEPQNPELHGLVQNQTYRKAKERIVEIVTRSINYKMDRNSITNIINMTHIRN